MMRASNQQTLPAQFPKYHLKYDHGVNPGSFLPCELIVKADGFDAWEIVHPGGSIATRTSCHQVAIGRFAAGAGFNSLQRPGEDVIQLRGFGELVHFLAFCLTDGCIMAENVVFGNRIL